MFLAPDILLRYYQIPLRLQQDIPSDRQPLNGSLPWRMQDGYLLLTLIFLNLLIVEYQFSNHGCRQAHHLMYSRNPFQ